MAAEAYANAILSKLCFTNLNKWPPNWITGKLFVLKIWSGWQMSMLHREKFDAEKNIATIKIYADLFFAISWERGEIIKRGGGNFACLNSFLARRQDRHVFWYRKARHSLPIIFRICRNVNFSLEFSRERETEIETEKDVLYFLTDFWILQCSTLKGHTQAQAGCCMH